MTIWIDAQMSPALAAWIRSNFAVNAVAVRDLGEACGNQRDLTGHSRRTTFAQLPSPFHSAGRLQSSVYSSMTPSSNRS